MEINGRLRYTIDRTGTFVCHSVCHPQEIDGTILRAALLEALKPENRPCLIHCNRGKHRTGSLIACLRRVRGWSLSATVAEYMLFAAPKARIEDQRFIEEFTSPSSPEWNQLLKDAYIHTVANLSIQMAVEDADTADVETV